MMVMCLTLLVAPGNSVPAGAESLADRIASARTRQTDFQRAIERQNRLLDDLRGQAGIADAALDSTTSQLHGINADQAAIKREIAAATAALAKVRSRHDALADELSRLDWTIALLDQQIAAGSEDLDARRRMLGARLVEAYRSQNTSLLEQLFGAGSFTDVLTNASAYLSYGEQDAQLAQDIAADQSALDGLHALAVSTRYRTGKLRRDTQVAAADLLAKQGRLREAKQRSAKLEEKVAALKERQLAAARRILGNRKEAKAALARQAAADRQLETHIKGLVAEAQRRAEARRLAEARRKAAAAREAAARRAEARRNRGGNQPPRGNGRFAWPVTGYVTQEFGCTGFPLEPRRGSCAHFHAGIDVANAPGTPIRAPDDGVVAFVGWNPYDGSDPSFLVVIGHSGGFETSYGHLESRYAVRAGQFVRRGQVIGYMGNTGNSTGTHLHWEVHRNGALVNPRTYL